MTFEDVYKDNADMVINLAYRMTGREEIARDLTQDIFLKVYKNQDSFRSHSKISTWVYRIALNHIINHLKKEKRISFLDFLDEHKNILNSGDGLTYWEQNLPQQPDEILEDGQKEIIVRKFVNDLPLKYRIPFVLYRYEDMSYQEIADKINISLSAVETRIHRAKKKLKEKLQPWINRL
jgi:RNA polymerase sigma-70 factor (ECF subfamily)